MKLVLNEIPSVSFYQPQHAAFHVAIASQNDPNASSCESKGTYFAMVEQRVTLRYLW